MGSTCPDSQSDDLQAKLKRLFPRTGLTTNTVIKGSMCLEKERYLREFQLIT